MRGLWLKELRSARPFLGLVLVVLLLGIVDEAMFELPSARPMARAYDDFVAIGPDGAMLVLLLVFALASGLLVREFDDGTIEFLDSLPVSRSRVFAVKVTAAAGVLLVLVVLDVGTGLVLHALSRNSLDRSFHLPFLATAVLLRACQMFVALGLGLAVSFLRRFGWLVLGLGFWVFILLRERIPAIAVFDLFALAEPRFEGDRWILPHRMLAAQLALGAASMAIAYGLFLGMGGRMLRGLGRLTQSRLGHACLLAAGGAVALVIGSLVYRVMEAEFGDEELDEDGVRVVYPSWGTSRATSTHYAFMYPVNLAGRARTLIDSADDVHQRVSRFFDMDAGDQIVVNATSLMPRHAGLAYWNTIRLDLTASDDNETLQSILGHETCHVLLDRLSDSRLADQFNSTRFFHEGVASYVEYHLFDPEPGVDALRSVAAVMRARDEVDFDELVDSQQLAARRDTNLVYPLGEVFVAALVERYGEASIGKIARAMARKDAPKNLVGLDLWRDAFQACQYNLDDVVDGFFAKLDAEVERHRELVDKLPRPRGAFAADLAYVYLFVETAPVEGWTTVCRFRDSRDTPDRLYLPGLTDDEDYFYQERSAFPGSSLWYQLGLSDGQGRVVYEPWIQVTLD